MNPSYAICGSKHGNRCEVWLKISTALPGVCNPHGLVVERKPLHRLQGRRGRVDLLEDDEGLSPHLQVLQRHDVQDLAELGEDGVQGFLQFWKKRKSNVNIALNGTYQ